MSTSRRMSPFRAAIGPGLLMAGAAVGVSHLVQSTRAGADFGLLLLPLVLLACLFKFPFLEFGPRYYAATGNNLLVGYLQLGRWALGLFTIITVGTMFIILAVVTVVTAGLAGLVLGVDTSPAVLSLGVLAACGFLLVLGHYRGLDLAMKMIISTLAVSTLAAVAFALGDHSDWSGISGVHLAPQVWTAAGFAFLLALIGWMPIPIESSVWHSLWSEERARATGQRPTLKLAQTDFALGYISATVLAAAFLLLGALLMFASGTQFSNSAVGFSAQLVDLYATSLGEWSRPLIAVAALTTMFSTTLAVADAYPRVMTAILRIARNSPAPAATGSNQAFAATRDRDRVYLGLLLLIMGGAWLIIYAAGPRFTQMIDFATILSFLAAPILAWMNLRVVTDSHMPEEARPGPLLTAFSWLSLAFAISFTLIWIGWRILA